MPFTQMRWQMSAVLRADYDVSHNRKEKISPGSGTSSRSHLRPLMYLALDASFPRCSPQIIQSDRHFGIRCIAPFACHLSVICAEWAAIWVSLRSGCKWHYWGAIHLLLKWRSLGMIRGRAARKRGIEGQITTIHHCGILHFTVVCLVAKPLNRSEATGDLVVIQTLLLFICKSFCYHAN